MAVAGETLVELDGREVRITSPDKVFFPERGETKLDLVRYYEAVREPVMATMGGRPVLLQRFPRAGPAGRNFFQKRVPKDAPDWLQTTIVSTPNGTTSNALVVADLAHVAWAVNLGCLGFHVWPSLAADPDHADELRIDLDPTPGITFDEVREGARRVKALLDELGLVGAPKTTGGDGLHVYVRLQPAVDLDRGAGLRRGPGPGAGAAPPRPPDRRLVEGGAGPAGVRRLQPELAPQDRVRRVVGAGPARRAGVGAVHLGRARHASIPTP